MLPEDYEQRVYAGWLGKCTGVRFGAPLEGWSYAEIRDKLGEVREYLPLEPGTIFQPDDDTSLPMIFLRAVEDFGPEVSAEEFGKAWLNYLGDEHGTLWWGGYGVSSEHTAYANLKNGIPAPRSGSSEMNGEVVSQQIGGQIFSDIWGLLVPDRPALAAEYAAKASSVSHDRNGIYGGMFVAALVSTAFSESQPDRLIRRALQEIPAASDYAKMVAAVLGFHQDNPADWHQAYRFIFEQFGYDRYPGTVPIIPNAAIVVMGLLYGKGDFSQSIQITNMGGWDTDCNVGNVGAVMGVAVGLDGIADQWRLPHNDLLVAASNIGTRNLLDIPACVDLIVGLGKRIAGEELPQQHTRYHFSQPGSTHGFLYTREQGNLEQRILRLEQARFQETGVLTLKLGDLQKNEQVRIYVETYLRPERLSANYYGAAFSPKIYPGQTLSARLMTPLEGPDNLKAYLYVFDENRGERHHGEEVGLDPGQWYDLQYSIPARDGVCLAEAGIAIRNLGEPCPVPLYVDFLDWSGPPDFGFDFSRERNEQSAISQWTFLRGFWRLEEGCFHGSGVGINEAYTGDIDWQDYTLKVRLTPLVGEHHYVLARVRGACYSYGFGLASHGRVALYKNEEGYHRVAEEAFSWVHGESYELHLQVAGSVLTAWITDGPIIRWEDEQNPYTSGQIGLSNFGGCHSRYESVSIAPV